MESGAILAAAPLALLGGWAFVGGVREERGVFACCVLGVGWQHNGAWQRRSWKVLGSLLESVGWCPVERGMLSCSSTELSPPALHPPPQGDARVACRSGPLPAPALLKPTG
jgi:hypothetical protein